MPAMSCRCLAAPPSSPPSGQDQNMQEQTQGMLLPVFSPHPAVASPYPEMMLTCFFDRAPLPWAHFEDGRKIALSKAITSTVFFCFVFCCCFCFQGASCRENKFLNWISKDGTKIAVNKAVTSTVSLLLSLLLWLPKHLGSWKWMAKLAGNVALRAGDFPLPPNT